MSEKLEPCPFCGSSAIREVELKMEGYRMGRKLHSFRCDNDDCPVCPSTKQYESRNEALASWNRRVPPPDRGMAGASRLQAIIAELKSFPPSPLIEDAIDSLERIL